jgi:chromosomal replication initiator protein
MFAAASQASRDDGIDIRRGRAQPVKGRDRRLVFAPSWHRDTQLVQRINGVVPRIVPFSEIKLSGEVQGHFPFPEEKPDGRPPTFDEIKAAVCSYFQILPSQIISGSRTWNICRPRQIAMWYCRRVTGKSFPSIGRYFGGRDHSTAISAVELIDRHIAAGGKLRDQVCAIGELMQRAGFILDLAMPL